MFCKNCGQQMPDGVMFCPNCGEQHNPPEAAAGNDFFNPAPETQSEPEKKSKKPIGTVVIAALLAVVVIVVAVLGISALGGNKYAKENTFASAMKGVDKDSAQYQALSAFAAVHNTVFNSESLEFSVKPPYEDNIEGKVVFGKDIASSRMVFEAEDGDIVASVFDGKFQAVGYDEGIEADIANILKGTIDLANEGFDMAEEELEDMKAYIDDLEEYGYDDEAIEARRDSYDSLVLFIERMRENVSSIDKAAQNLISNKHINYDAFAELYNNIVVPYLEIAATVRGEEGFKAPTFEFWWEAIAEFLAKGLTDDAIEVEVSKDGKGKKAVTTYKIEINMIEAASDLYDYASAKEEFKAVLGEDADDYFDMLEARLDEAERYVDDDEATIKVTVKVQNNYVTEIKPNVDGMSFKVSIANVNDTTVTEEEYLKVKEEFDDADDVYTFDSMNDIIDEIF